MITLFSVYSSRVAVTIYPEKEYGPGGAGYYMHSIADPEKHFTPIEVRLKEGFKAMRDLRRKARIRMSS